MLGKRQRQVIGRLKEGKPVRRMGAFGRNETLDVPPGETTHLWADHIEEQAAKDGFFTKDTLDRLEIRGLITAGAHWGQYALTSEGAELAEAVSE